MAKWQPTSLPKPVERHPDPIRQWIQAVYEEKQFLANGDRVATAPPPPPPPQQQQPSTSTTPTAASKRPQQPPSPNNNTSSNNNNNKGDIPDIQTIASILGSDAPRLIVGTKQDPAAALAMARTDSMTGTTSAISSGSKHNATEHMIQQPSSPVDLLGMPSPTAAANGNNTFQAWDAFAEDVGTAVGVPQVSSSSSPQKQQWAAFGGDKANGATHQAIAHPAVQQQQGELHTWEAFGDAPLVDQVPARSAPPPPAVAPVAHHPEQQHQQQQQPPSPSRPPPPPPPPPVVHRAEVPLDIFYPEFEQIRATGVLPTGQRLPGYYPAAPPPAPVAVARSPASLASSYLPFPLPVAQGQGQRQVAAAANIISNSSSMNGRTGEADPFANLSTGFKAALPPSPQYRPPVAPGMMPVAAPPPPPAAVLAAPSNVYSAPISSASTTLYGSQRQQPSSQYIGYDLTAPAAAKAKSSGNPFA